MSSFNMSKDIPASFLILFNQTDSFLKTPLNKRMHNNQVGTRRITTGLSLGGILEPKESGVPYSFKVAPSERFP